MDTKESKDLAQVTALLASYQLVPSSVGVSQSPPGFQPLTSEIASKYSSQPRTSGDSPGNAFKMVKISVSYFWSLPVYAFWFQNRFCRT